MENVRPRRFIVKVPASRPTSTAQDIEYDVPSQYTLHVRVAPVGAPDEQAFFSKVIYSLTPETRTSTHDFWVIARPAKNERAPWAQRSGVLSQNTVFGEDQVALEALEENLPAEGGWQELSINNDVAACSGAASSATATTPNAPRAKKPSSKNSSTSGFTFRESFAFGLRPSRPLSLRGGRLKTTNSSEWLPRSNSLC